MPAELLLSLLGSEAKLAVALGAPSAAASAAASELDDLLGGALDYLSAAELDDMLADTLVHLLWGTSSDALSLDSYNQLDNLLVEESAVKLAPVLVVEMEAMSDQESVVEMAVM